MCHLKILTSDGVCLRRPAARQLQQPLVHVVELLLDLVQVLDGLLAALPGCLNLLAGLPACSDEALLCRGDLVLLLGG